MNPTRALGLPAGWMQGVDMTDAAAAGVGLAAATILPELIVKDTSKTSGKILKIVAALGSAVLAGMLLKKWNPGAGKAAVLGGMAGTVIQAVGAFTPLKIGGGALALPMGRIGETSKVWQSPSREGETVNMIQP